MDERTATSEPVANSFGLLVPEQLAKVLGVTVRTLQKWEQLRIGPPRIVIQRQVFYREESVRQWLAQREQRRKR